MERENAHFISRGGEAMLGALRRLCGVVAILVVLVGLLGGVIWYAMRPTTYDFGNGARLEVPHGAVSFDQRDEGYGIVIESGYNVTVYNDSDEWRTLTVSYRKPNYGILDTHAFEDLPPNSTKAFGADPAEFDGMHVSVSDFAQRERDEEAST